MFGSACVASLPGSNLVILLFPRRDRLGALADGVGGDGSGDGDGIDASDGDDGGGDTGVTGDGGDVVAIGTGLVCSL